MQLPAQKVPAYQMSYDAHPLPHYVIPDHWERELRPGINPHEHLKQRCAKSRYGKLTQQCSDMSANSFSSIATERVVTKIDEKPAFILDVDLGEQGVYQVAVFRKSNPAAVSKLFAMQHDLDKQRENRLTALIESKMSQLGLRRDQLVSVITVTCGDQLYKIPIYDGDTAEEAADRAAVRYNLDYDDVLEVVA